MSHVQLKENHLSLAIVTGSGVVNDPGVAMKTLPMTLAETAGGKRHFLPVG